MVVAYWEQRSPRRMRALGTMAAMDSDKRDDRASIDFIMAVN